jgi:hypothetical protein
VERLKLIRERDDYRAAALVATKGLELLQAAMEQRDTAGIAEIVQAMETFSQNYHALHVKIAEHDERSTNDRAKLMQTLEGLADRIAGLGRQIDARFDQIWREHDNFKTEVSMRLQDFEARIAALEARL